MAIKNPFVDDVGKNLQLFSRGEYGFLKAAATRLTPQGRVFVAPDLSTFTGEVVSILDPNGIDVTPTFITNELDPESTIDIWDNNHQDYLGDLDTGSENIGLFAEGYNNGNINFTGRLAQKIKVPLNAVKTISDQDTYYRVIWRIFRNGTLFVDQATGNPPEEYFNVQDIGDIFFGSSPVTPALIKSGYQTSLTDEEIQELIDEATCWAKGLLGACGSNPETVNDGAPLVKNAIILYTRALLFDLDASAGKVFTRIKEGTKSVNLSGNSSKDIENMRMRARLLLDDYCKAYSPKRQVRLRVATRKYKTGIGAAKR